jgi:hypothetical protein
MNRKELLEQLLNLKHPVSRIQDELSKYPWDSDSEVISVDKKHLYKILDLFVEDKISNKVVEDWSNALELRDDVGYTSEVLKEIIEELANPILYGKLDKTTIENIKQRLG